MENILEGDLRYKLKELPKPKDLEGRLRDIERQLTNNTRLLWLIVGGVIALFLKGGV